MGRYKKWVAPVLIVVVLLCAGSFLFEAKTRSLRRLADDVLYDNRNHYLPCEQLPALPQVEGVVKAHQDVIRQIEQVNPGSVGVEIDTLTCPGKADILFWYGAHQDRLAIEGIIGGNTFWGIPYRLQNR